MGCEAGRCKTSTPKGIFNVIPSLEGWPTKAKEAPSPHEVRLARLDTNPVFQSLGGEQNEQNTRSASHGLLMKLPCNTSKYGTNTFAASAITLWNSSQKMIYNNNLYKLSYSQLKVLIKNYFFIFYNEDCS